MTFSPKRYCQTLIDKKSTLGVFSGYKQEIIYNALRHKQNRFYFH